MSGIFDRMNHQPPPLDERRIAPAFLRGILAMRVAGVRTNAELLTAINDALDTPLDAESQSDLNDMVTFILAGASREEKIARIDGIEATAGIWETGLAAITEAEARTMTGVTYTF